MIVYAILGLLLVAVIVFVVLSAKDWHWLNLVLIVFVFIAGSAAMLAMAQTLHLRTKAIKRYDSALKDAQAKTQLANDAVFGKADSAEYGADSVRGLAQQVNLLRIGRGRVYSNGSVSNTDGQIRFEFPTELPDGNDDALTLQDTELFAFQEVQRPAADGDGQISIPVGFIGKFLVVEQQPKFLVMERTGLLGNFTQYQQPTGTWSLYERMPFDRHGIFRDVMGLSDVQEEDFKISEFRNALINFMPAQMFGLEANSAPYERLIDEFCFDGLSLGKIQNWVESQAASRVSKRFEPKLDEVFVRYRFEKTSDPYDVDDTSGKLDTDGTFTINGLAVDPTLHLPENKQVVFKKDDIVNIDLRTAEGYQRPDGTEVPAFAVRESVVEVGRFYSRTLTDYPFEMTNIFNRSEKMADDADRLIENNEVQQLANDDTLLQQQERSRLIASLEKDNGMLQQDLDQVTALLQSLEDQQRGKAEMIESLLEEMNSLQESLRRLALPQITGR